MLRIDLVEYLTAETLHHKVVEAIDITRISHKVATYCCTFRYWDSSSDSINRIRLTFHDAEISGRLYGGFDIYDASFQMIGDYLRVAITECSSGLHTFILCSKADVSECVTERLPID